tara:strand:+ start:12538 stop:13092 length:555 start_codon:yes stop_codon:yes gene_type:complete
MNRVGINLRPEVFYKCDQMAEGIFADKEKARGRTKEVIFNDCLKGLALESWAADKFGFNFNLCPEDKRYPGTYDHDLVCPTTNERYEVKQSSLSNTKNFGKTLQFHDSIFDIAKQEQRYFQWFIFGETFHVEPLQRTATVKIYAIIPRDAIIYHSQQSAKKPGYRYFRDVLADKDYNSTILFKN